MSATAVRKSFRDALQAAFPAVQYIETIASRVDNNTLQPLWHTFAFVAESDLPVAIGKPTCWRELGTARVWIGASTGAGDTALSTHADAVADYFRNYTDPAIQLRTTGMLPLQTEEESSGRWAIGYVDIRYQRDRTV